MSDAVCMVSGGLDSCVTAAIAHSRGLPLAFLHVKERELDLDYDAYFDMLKLL